MKRISYAVLLFSAIALSHSVFAGTTSSPKGAKAYIASPQNGEIVPTTFKVKFGLSGMGVAPAGVDKKNTGHHHLLVNGKALPEKNKKMGKNVKHFGGGQTETILTLPPGEHTLQLILGDKNHIPHNPPVISEKVTIIVD